MSSSGSNPLWEPGSLERKIEGMGSSNPPGGPMRVIVGEATPTYISWFPNSYSLSIVDTRLYNEH